MASKATLLIMEEMPIYAAVDQPKVICQELWSDLYRDHHHYVLQICRRFFRRPEDAEDAAAEVFLKLCRVVHQKNDTLPFRPWLTQVAWHHCIDRLRRRKNEKNASVEGVELSNIVDRSSPSPLSQILHKDQQRHVREQLIRLPEKYKVPLMLRYYRGMSYSEIARALNTRLPTVRMMVFRAKNYLRRNLRRSGAVGFGDSRRWSRPLS